MATTEGVRSMSTARKEHKKSHPDEIRIKAKNGCTNCGGDIIIVVEHDLVLPDQGDFIGTNDASDLVPVIKTSNMHCQKCGIVYQIIPE